MASYASAAARVLDSAAKAGAQYADVQFWTMRSENLFVRNGDVRDASDARSLGYGVRALVDGSWGFYGSDRFSDADFDRVAAAATAIARSGARVAGRVRAVAPAAAVVAHWETPTQIDPATVSLSERAAFLLAVEKSMHVAKNVVAAYASMQFWTTEKEFYSTTGSAITQTLRQAGGGCGATAIGMDQDAQTRTTPEMFNQGGGYEVIHRARLAEQAPEIGREGTIDLILAHEVLSLQMHESIGHPLELDRALGWEANFSGTSWVHPSGVGTTRYGSDLLNIYVDNAMPLGLATVGYDDEAVKPRRVPLIEHGILRAFLSSRDTAAQTGLPETASTHAQDWASIPMVRISNIGLVPHEGTLASIVADTKDGIVVDGLTSWSIDDHRLNFQFGPQIAYAVKNGKRGKIYKQPTYTGATPHFWGSMDRVAGESEFIVLGTVNCGKGEPEQNGHTSHACSVARFRNVKVGVKADA
jgi:TldD protein